MRPISLTAAMAVGLMLAGCRAPSRMAARVTEVPRVDIELEGGNRGYLVGTPPPPGERSTTRQMVQTDVELPSWYRPHAGPSTAPLDGMAPPETDQMAGAEHEPMAGGPTGGTTGDYATYTVQKGESLWSISKKVYGKATAWRQIFDANRDQLKSPDQVRPGMTLRIPQSAPAQFGDDGGRTYQK